MDLQTDAQLARDTIAIRPTSGIPTWMLNVMDWPQLEQVSGNPPGSYEREPERVYREFQLAAGVCFIDQWIPRNPLTMRSHGYETDERGATTGASAIIVDGMMIDSPEAVAEHMEKHLFPGLEERRRHLESHADEEVRQRIAGEAEVQRFFGPNLLKVPYSGFFALPTLRYMRYGYANYFMAYALFPELMERCFRLEADVAEVHNRVAARAIVEGGLPPLVRLDHDMADSSGTLVDIKSLDRIWFPHFARAIRPLLDAGVRLIWHCDGNLMAMVPRMLECGLGGFQGFQYEDGMEYERICRMKTRDGDDLFIIAGVSVTTTLPHGTPADVRAQLNWLVEKGPRVGLALGASSSIAPGVPRENLQALIEGLTHYRTHGRG